MIRTAMFFLMNWGYLVAALWIIGGIALWHFIPPEIPYKGHLLTAIGFIAAAHLWSAYVFHDGVAYQMEIYEKVAAKEAKRQQDALDAAQNDGAKTVLNLAMEKAAREKLQKDYDKLSVAFNTRQCLDPEQLRRIQQTGRPSGSK